jgi:hypothetical protein
MKDNSSITIAALMMEENGPMFGVVVATTGAQLAAQRLSHTIVWKQHTLSRSETLLPCILSKIDDNRLGIAPDYRPRACHAD